MIDPADLKEAKDLAWRLQQKLRELHIQGAQLADCDAVMRGIWDFINLVNNEPVTHIRAGH